MKKVKKIGYMVLGGALVTGWLFYDSLFSVLGMHL